MCAQNKNLTQRHYGLGKNFNKVTDRPTDIFTYRGPLDIKKANFEFLKRTLPKIDIEHQFLFATNKLYIFFFIKVLISDLNIGYYTNKKYFGNKSLIKK